MKFDIFFVVRYSILLSGAKGYWEVGRLGYKDYKKELFSDGRLGSHQYLFENIVLPSIFGQKLAGDTQHRVGLIVLTSKELPDFYKKRLCESVESFRLSAVVEIDEERKSFNKELNEAILKMKREDATLVTSRLDDDDAVTSDFSQRIIEYCEKGNFGTAISLGKGYALELGGDLRVAAVKSYIHNKNAQGMCYVSQGKDDIVNVYELGSHSLVDRKVPVILDSVNPAFLRSFHHDADAQSKNKDWLGKMKLVSGKEVGNSFSLSKEFLEQLLIL